MDARSIRVPEDRIRGSYAAALSLIQSAEAPEAETPADGKPAALARFISPVAPASGSAGQKRTRVNLESVLREDGDALLPPERHAVLFEARRALAVGMTVGELFVSRSATSISASATARARCTARTSTVSACSSAQRRWSRRSRQQPTWRRCRPRRQRASRARPATSRSPTPPTRSPGSCTAWSMRFGASQPRTSTARSCAHASMSWTGPSRPLHPRWAKCSPISPTPPIRSRRTGFHVHGFDRPGGKRKASVDVQFKAPHEVVGNHIAKSQSMRLARMLASP